MRYKVARGISLPLRIKPAPKLVYWVPTVFEQLTRDMTTGALRFLLTREKERAAELALRTDHKPTAPTIKIRLPGSGGR